MKPLVSICCITYNQEKYIANALDSLLSQETSFDFEIIVHDDASTDNTVKIIEEYVKKFPFIIKPIYQRENQFSQGKKITFECVAPYITGDILAFCEGDDYWTDINKLQKQVDFLLDNPKYSACFHSVKVVDINRQPIGRYLGPIGSGDGDYDMKSNINESFIHLSSLVIKSNILKQNLPQWALKFKYGDITMAILISANGKVHYIDKEMSAYRLGVENSIMTKERANYSTNNLKTSHQEIIKYFEEVDKYYNYRFSTDIEHYKHKSEIILLLLNKEFKGLFRKRYKAYFQEEGVIYSSKLILSTMLPKFTLKLGDFKRKIRRIKIQTGRN